MNKKPINNLRRKTIIFGILIFTVSYIMLLRGSEWSQTLHPDESTIANWIEETSVDGCFRNRVYPSGFFELTRPMMSLRKKSTVLSEKIRKYISQDEPIGILPSVSALYNGPQYMNSKTILESGRAFNIVLASFSAVFVFLTVLFVTNGLLPSVLASLFVPFNVYLVEHSHYCETDISLVFSMSVAFFLLIYSVKKNDFRILTAAVFAAGFSVSCKYTFAPVLITILATALYLNRLRKSGVSCYLYSVIAVLFVFAVGFTTGTPLLYMDCAKFLEIVGASSSAVYLEMTGILGEMADVPGAANLYKARMFLDAASNYGGLWWCWIAFSIPFWFTAKYRKYLVTLPLFSICFILFVVFCMPYFRNQEFFPMLIPLAVTAILPAAYFIEKTETPWRKTRAVAVCFCVVFLLAQAFQSSLRISSCFVRKETRSVLRDWIASSVSPDTTIGLYSYAGQVGYELPCAVVFAGKIDLQTWDYAQSNKAEYLVAITDMPARGIRHPWTKQLYPSYAANRIFFTNNAELVRTCKISDSKHSRPTFPQTDLELWRIPRGEIVTNKINIPVIIQRPVHLVYGNETYYPAADGVFAGSEIALRTVGKRASTALRVMKGRSYYAVSRNAKGNIAATIRWNDFFTPRNATVSPHSADVFMFSDGFAKSAYDILPRTKVRMKGDDSQTLCITTITPEPAHAAYLLRIGGSPDKAVDFVRSLGDVYGNNDSCKIQAFLAASECGQKPEKEWTVAAELAVDNYKKIVSESTAVPGEVRVSGTSLTCMRDFSVLRLGGKTATVHDMPITDDGICSVEAELPVFLDPGEYDLTLCADTAVQFDTLEPLQSLMVTGCKLSSVEIGPDYRGTRTLSAHISVAESVWPRLSLCVPGSDVTASFRFKGIDIKWDPDQMLAVEIEKLSVHLDSASGLGK